MHFEIDLALRNNLEAMADFHGVFPFHKWGVNTRKVKTISCIIKNPTGEYYWIQGNVASTTKSSKAVGAFRKAADQPG